MRQSPPRVELLYFPDRLIVRIYERISEPGVHPVVTQPVERIYIPATSLTALTAVAPLDDLPAMAVVDPDPDPDPEAA